MNLDPQAASLAQYRNWAYVLIIVLAAATQTARIARVESFSGRTPLLSANDRSRWAAIRAVVDDGTFALDDVVLRRDVPPKTPVDPAPWPYRGGPPSNRDRDWYSIDMVRHRGPDGLEHYYSSKPPLLNVILSGPYWLFSRITGATLANQPFFVVRWLLVLINVVPFAGMVWGIAQWAEAYARTDWAKLFVVATAGFATLLTPFASTLNNHSVAALAVFVSLVGIDRIVRSGGAAGGWWYALTGTSAALTSVAELPALAWVAAVLVAMAWLRPLRTVCCAVPPVIAIAALSFGANYLAHHSLRPPYMHRHDGPVVATIAQMELPSNRGKQTADTDTGDALQTKVVKFVQFTLEDDRPWEWIPTRDPNRFVLWQPESSQRLAVVRETGRIEIRAWDNWYEYEGTYWTDEGRAGVDRGEASHATYALHVLVGHHGLFSVTPVWLFTVLGLAVWLRSGDVWQRRLASGIAAVTLVVLAFYLGRPLIDRNYGGVSCGFRWMLWLAPLWLVGLIPGADWAARSPWSRAAAWLLFGASAFSAAYSAQNPWSHPWLFEYWTQLGWIRY